MQHHYRNGVSSVVTQPAVFYVSVLSDSRHCCLALWWMWWTSSQMIQWSLFLKKYCYYWPTSTKHVGDEKIKQETTAVGDCSVQGSNVLIAPVHYSRSSVHLLFGLPLFIFATHYAQNNLLYQPLILQVVSCICDRRSSVSSIIYCTMLMFVPVLFIISLCLILCCHFVFNIWTFHFKSRRRGSCHFSSVWMSMSQLRWIFVYKMGNRTQRECSQRKSENCLVAVPVLLIRVMMFYSIPFHAATMMTLGLLQNARYQPPGAAAADHICSVFCCARRWEKICRGKLSLWCTWITHPPFRPGSPTISATNVVLVVVGVVIMSEHVVPQWLFIDIETDDLEWPWIIEQPFYVKYCFPSVIV